MGKHLQTPAGLVHGTCPGMFACRRSRPGPPRLLRGDSHITLAPRAPLRPPTWAHTARSTREQWDPCGTRAGPGRDPGGTRAGPGRDPAPQECQTEVRRRPMGTWHAAVVKPARSHRSSGRGTATMGHRTVRGTVPKGMQRFPVPVVPGSSRVPSGSQPGPEQSKKVHFARSTRCFRALKPSNKDAEPWPVSPWHCAAPTRAPHSLNLTKCGFVSVCTVFVRGFSGSIGWRDKLVTSR